MIVYVDQGRCRGCGVCLEACSTGALQLVDGLARVVMPLCNGCQECVAACPQHAILTVTESETERLPARAASLVPNQARAIATISSPPLAVRALPWLGAALSLVARQVIPRLIDLLLPSGERSTSSAQQGMASPSVRDATAQGGRAAGNQHRHRGRHGAS